MMDGLRPEVWCSDRYAARQGHAPAHQTCLAHLARDVAYALDLSQDDLAFWLKLWLQKTFALTRDITTFAAPTVAIKRCPLERSLDDIPDASSSSDLAQALKNGFRRARDQLLTFAR